MRFCSFFIFFHICSFNLSAETVHFDLLSNDLEAIDEVMQIEIENSDLLLSLSSNDGVLNRTANGFGVNATGSGDDTDGLDQGSGIHESIFLHFDQAVLLESILLGHMGNNDMAILTIEGIDYGITSSNNPFSQQIMVAANKALALSFYSGNGFSFNSITVSKSNVPLPATFSLLLSTIIPFSLLRKRK